VGLVISTHTEAGWSIYSVKPNVSDVLDYDDHRHSWTAVRKKNWVSMLLDSTCTHYHTHTPNVGLLISTPTEAGWSFYLVNPIVSDASKYKEHCHCWIAVCNKNWVSMVLDSTCTHYHTHIPNVGLVIGTHTEAGGSFFSEKPIVSDERGYKEHRHC
jgi:hypothetical protein